MLADDKLRVEGAQSTASMACPDDDRIVIVDVQVLSRECLARVLSHDQNVPAECFATLDDWMASGQLTHPSVVVLCQYGRSGADALNEVGRLAELAPHCPAVILSDNEDPDLIVRMLGKNVRGYVPTSLSIAVVIQAIQLVRAGGVYVPASSLIAAHSVQESDIHAGAKAYRHFHKPADGRRRSAEARQAQQDHRLRTQHA